MVTLRRLFAGALITPAAASGVKQSSGAHFCSSNLSFPLTCSRSFPIRNHRGLCSGRILSTAARRQNEEPTPVEAELVESSEEEAVWIDDFDGEEEEEERKFSYKDRFTGRKGPEYDKDPEFAEILGSCFDDPEKAQARVEERIRKKRNKIIHTKTGSPDPLKVTFNKFNFSNSYIWFEFYNAPLSSDISLICDAIRSWHIIGRLGGCNSMNMQLSQLPLDHKRPTYDAIQGANITPTTFYNIGDLEIQDNLARIWVDIGTSEPLLLDVLINALFQISSDYVGIKQVVFGGSGFENWKENFKSEDADVSIHKI